MAQEQQTFYGSPTATDTVKDSRAFVERLTDAVCYAACKAKVELDGVLRSAQLLAVFRKLVVLCKLTDRELDYDTQLSVYSP